MSARSGPQMSGSQRAGGLNVPQVARILPGPAGKLQQLAAAGALQQATPEALGLRDCTSTSSSTAGTGSQLHTIKMAKAVSLGKVPKTLVMLGSFQPSGSGSAFAKIKDPTGSMGAALHSSVLQQQAELGSGCVLLLQQVSVFTPSPGTTYAAVTARNIVRVWGAESPQDSIRNARHAQQQQQQQPWTQQQQAQPPAAFGQLGKQQQQPQCGAGGLSQPPQQQQGMVPPAAGRAPLLPPASPHLQVLNGQRQRRTSLRQHPGLQAQVQHGGQLQEEQGEVSPAVSLGSAAASRQTAVGPAAALFAAGEASGRGLAGQMSQQQLGQQLLQQQHNAQGRARCSMPPPPPRMQPFTFRAQDQRLQQQPGQQTQQQLGEQQLQQSGVNVSQQSTAADSLAQLFASPKWPGGMVGGLAGADTQQQLQQQQQVSQHSQLLRHSQQQSAGGLQQPASRSTMPYQLQQRRASAAAGPAAKAHASVQPDSMDVDALDAGEDDEMDDVVAAIFGSQVPPPTAGSTASQQQQRQQQQPARQIHPAMPGGVAADAQQGEPSQKRLKAAAAAATGAVTGAVLPGGGSSSVWGLQQPGQQQGKAPGSSHSKAASGSGTMFGVGTGSSFCSQQQQQQQRVAPLASPALSGAGSAASGGGVSTYPGSAKVPLSARPFTAAAAAGEPGRGQPLLHGRQAVNLLDDLLGEDLEELDG